MLSRGAANFLLSLLPEPLGPPDLGPTQPPKWVPGFSPGGKEAGA